MLVAVLALALAGCMGPLFGGRRSAAADRRALDAALATSAHDPALGRARLSAFLDTHPDSALLDDAALALARLDLDAGDEVEAERVLRLAIARQPRGDRSDAARLELAELLRKGGAPEAAWEQGRAIRTPYLSAEERRRAARLMADLARERDDARAEVEWLARLRQDATPEEAAGVDRQLARALAALPTEALLQVAEGLEGAAAGGLWIAAAERAAAEGDRSTVTRVLARASRLPLLPEDQARLERLSSGDTGVAPLASGSELPPPLGEIAADAPWPLPRAQGALGVVLPLSGTYAPIAEDTLRGVLLAARLFGPDATEGLRVVVRDSGGTAEGAAAALRELAGEPDVVAVVGPLLTETLESAVEVSRETGLPLLVPTRHEWVVQPDAPIFRLGLTRRSEAELLAEHAVVDLGMRRIAILHPKDEYGREFEALLWRALEARGARVVGAAGYASHASGGNGEFSGPVRALLGWPLLSEAERARVAARDAAATSKESPGAAPAAPDARAGVAAEPIAGRGFRVEDPAEEALPPIVDFQGLFVPDTADEVALAVPTLAAEHVDGVTLFGSSAWQHAHLLRGGPRLEGAFFTSGFDPGNPSTLVREFVRRYREAFGEEPNVFAAQGFDAANLVMLQLARGARTREELVADLRRVSLHPGVSGVTSFAPDGDARKRPFLMGVRAGRFVSLQ